MSEPIRIRAQRQGTGADIRVLMAHPMETGQRKDENGQAVPMHFIQRFSVRLNGQALIDGQLNTSISRNPLFAFKANNIKAGDKISVHWQDNTGAQRQDEISLD
ncbi:MAG: thiosulfate oxidation carrier complex protein SoxZ [Azonexus sp.]|jgi:sulfur-oxidizing protein SoxZ|nr:thiosulfate oxidation carrier complex protein SoxZ [Azonexus sp.]